MNSHETRFRAMGLLVTTIGIALFLSSGCGKNSPIAPETTGAAVTTEVPAGAPGAGKVLPANKITGDVEILWKGGKGMDSTQAARPRRAFLSIAAFEPTATRSGHGTAVYTVTDSAGAVHRQITIQLEGSRIDVLNGKAWYRGVVIADSKGCDGGSGGPGGGHDVDCPGDTGGCGEDHDHTEGGCNTGGHDDGHDGGCSDDGGCGGSGGMGGGMVSGRNCRVGQYFVGKAHDAGTPGAAGDGITWKWFDPNDPAVPVLDDLSTWFHLCGKTIIAGNIVIHGYDGGDDDVLMIGR